MFKNNVSSEMKKILILLLLMISTNVYSYGPSYCDLNEPIPLRPFLVAITPAIILKKSQKPHMALNYAIFKKICVVKLYDLAFVRI